MKKVFLRTSFFLLFLALGSSVAAGKQDWDLLSQEERVTLGRILDEWQTWVPQMKKNGGAPLMTFNELYAGLDPQEKNLLDRVRALRPPDKSFYGEPDEKVSFKKIETQTVERKGKSETLDAQYLPEHVYEAYSEMLGAMQRDLGKKLLVDSGYRSPAYQLYTYLFFLPKHGYSLKETRRWVALPGYSEHGAPERQAVDFINQQGINGDDEGQSAGDFERLPEFQWLQNHAGDFGFELSYPRGTPGSAYEPWHWRYIRRS